ncbi:unnamed protein product [Caenorhabditis auriculariae]|uniref:B30.2/SPRY domain-containing protein n=1 Tax=Caenorhabditis auriculariae TaxID=2777116 RepID=A0A8S1HHW9_9PELO|nr:unnamed protein product [Caenorhabditis auriculariae]
MAIIGELEGHSRQNCSCSSASSLPESVEDWAKGLQPDQWTWTSEPNNMEAVVQGDRVTFHPVYAFGTAGVRGGKKLTATTVAYWEIEIAQPLYGTSVMFGVGTADAKTLARSQFIDLLGDDENSFGLNHLGMAYHGGVGVAVSREVKSTNCVIGVLFDGPRQRISYFENGVYLCTPFADINVSLPFYPMISSTAQQSQFIVRNQFVHNKVKSLYDVALRQVHLRVPGKALDSLPLPRTMLRQLREMDRKRSATQMTYLRQSRKRVNHVSATLRPMCNFSFTASPRIARS